MLLAGSPDKVLLISFKNPKLKPLTGKTLAEVAQMRGKSPEETAIDLVIEDGSRVGTVYFLMNEDNVKRETGAAVDELRLRRSVGGARGRVPEIEHHPRAYGNFARVPRPLCPRRESDAAARRHPPADLAAGDQSRHRASAARSRPAITPTWSCSTRRRSRTTRPSRSRKQLATGVDDVFVNGVQVLRDGKHTGAKPGRFVRGPGWTGWPGGGACKP